MIPTSQAHILDGTYNDRRLGHTEGVPDEQFGEYRTQLTRDTKVMWTPDISLHRRSLRILHRTSRVTCSYALIAITSVCDSRYLLTA